MAQPGRLLRDLGLPRTTPCSPIKIRTILDKIQVESLFDEDTHLCDHSSCCLGQKPPTGQLLRSEPAPVGVRYVPVIVEFFFLMQMYVRLDTSNWGLFQRIYSVTFYNS